MQSCHLYGISFCVRSKMLKGTQIRIQIQDVTKAVIGTHCQVNILWFSSLIVVKIVKNWALRKRGIPKSRDPNDLP